MQRLAALLADDQAETIAPYYRPAAELPVEAPAAAPPRQLDTRVTQVRERRSPATAENDPHYQRWRGQQRRAEDDQARRLIQREARR